MKRFVKIAGAGLVVVFVVLTVWTLTIPGPMLREAVNRMGPSILHAPVRCEKISVQLWRGYARLEDLEIWNPEGFSSNRLARLGVVEIMFQPSSLLTDCIVIHQIAITDPEFRLELGLKGNNLKKLKDGLKPPKVDGGSAGTPAGAKPAASPAPPPAGTPKPDKKVIIEEATVNGAVVRLAIGEAAAPIAVSPLTFRDIGKNSGGAMISDAVSHLTAGILKSVIDAAVKSNEALKKSADQLLGGDGTGESVEAFEKSLKDAGKKLKKGLKTLLQSAP